MTYDSERVKTYVPVTTVPHAKTAGTISNVAKRTLRKGPPGKSERGDRLWELRKSRGWKQHEVPGVERLVINNVENGRNQATSAEVRDALAAGFGVPPSAMSRYLDGELTTLQLNALRYAVPAAEQIARALREKHGFAPERADGAAAAAMTYAAKVGVAAVDQLVTLAIGIDALARGTFVRANGSGTDDARGPRVTVLVDRSVDEDTVHELAAGRQKLVEQAKLDAGDTAPDEVREPHKHSK